eukprot:jgi/Phyca11/511122/fgenesh2_kg.PHYCAscaffold_76_\
MLSLLRRAWRLLPGDIFVLAPPRSVKLVGQDLGPCIFSSETGDLAAKMSSELFDREPEPARLPQCADSSILTR